MIATGLKEPTGTQRARIIAKRLGLNPEVLVNRLRIARCVRCNGELSYVRRYMEKQHCCEACAQAISPEIREALDEVLAYV